MAEGPCSTSSMPIAWVAQRAPAEAARRCTWLPTWRSHGRSGAAETAARPHPGSMPRSGALSRWPTTSASVALQRAISAHRHTIPDPPAPTASATRPGQTTQPALLRTAPYRSRDPGERWQTRQCVTQAIRSRASAGRASPRSSFAQASRCGPVPALLKATSRGGRLKNEFSNRLVLSPIPICRIQRGNRWASH